MKDNTFWLGVVFVITFGIVTLVGTLSYFDNENKLNMAKNGYEQVQKQGTTDFVWQKVR